MRFPKPVCSKTGKTAYMDHKSAEQHLERVQEKWDRGDQAGFDVPPTRIFKCGFCHFFHLTHHPKKEVLDAPPLDGSTDATATVVTR